MYRGISNRSERKQITTSREVLPPTSDKTIFFEGKDSPRSVTQLMNCLLFSLKYMVRDKLARTHKLTPPPKKKKTKKKNVGKTAFRGRVN